MASNRVNLKILIADDQPEVRSAMRLLLEQQPDLQITGEAADAASLLILLAGDTADLLLLDWELPGKSGSELVPALRNLYPRLCIIVTDSQPSTGHPALAAGAAEYLSKNEPPERLVEVIRRCRPPEKQVQPSTGKGSYAYSGFTAVKVGGAFRLEIIKSDSFNIEVIADDPAHILVEQENDILKIGRRGFDWMFPLHRQPEIIIQMPELNKILVSGASTGKIRGFESSHDLEIELNGASHLDIKDVKAGNVHIKSHGASILSGNLTADSETKINVVGAGRMELEGSTKELCLSAMGASKANLEHFPAAGAAVKLMGASRAVVNVNGKLDANLAGASNLSWVGTPIMGIIEIIGASTIRKK